MTEQPAGSPQELAGNEPITPVSLAVYSAEPSSRPTEAVLEQVFQIVPHITYMRVEGFQGTSVVVQRCSDGRMVGMVYYGYSTDDSHAGMDFYHFREQLPEGRQNEMEFIDVHKLLGVGGNKYYDTLKRAIYPAGTSITLVESQNLHAESIVYAPSEESVNSFSRVGKSVKDLKPDEIYYEYGGRPTVLPVVLRFDEAEHKFAFEELLKHENQMQVLNAVYSSILSRGVIDEMYMALGGAILHGNIDLKAALTPQSYDGNMGNVVGIRRFDSFYRVNASDATQPAQIK